jgi:phosphoribosyl 1,2-cyclic phosphate phosphodiesterase
MLVINALQKSPHVSHFTLDEALLEIKKINPGMAYITHISHRMGLSCKSLQGIASKCFTGL